MLNSKEQAMRRCILQVQRCSVSNTVFTYYTLADLLIAVIEWLAEDFLFSEGGCAAYVCVFTGRILHFLFLCILYLTVY